MRRTRPLLSLLFALGFWGCAESLGELFPCGEPGDSCSVGSDCCSGSCGANSTCGDLVCGDGLLSQGEACDDANTQSGDGCRADCLGRELCGDGLFDPAAQEECDDGNLEDTDACTTTCKLAFCGDGFLQEKLEQCEPPGQANCDPDCQIGCEKDTHCQDQDACTQNERCANGACVADTPDLDDQDACTTDACDPADAQITHTPLDIDDQDACTADACDPLTGDISHTPFGSDDNPCTIDECDPLTGQVTHTPLAEGAPCDTNADQGPREICRASLCTLSLCGDGFLDLGAQEECDGENFGGEGCASLGVGFNGGSLLCDSLCRYDTNNCSVSCGDGITDPGEECDDGGQLPNDGCDASCLFEADEFVRCGGPPGGDGDLSSPFNSLQAAISDAGTLSGETVMLLPDSPVACAGAGPINKSLTIQGLAEAPGVRPVIDGAANEALLIEGSGIVVVRDLLLRSNQGQATVVVRGGAQVALLRIDITNDGTGASSQAIDCDQNAKLLLDQSNIHDTQKGGLRARGSCRVVVANALLQSNGASDSNRGAIEVEGDALVDVLLSTFDGNAANGGAVFDCESAGQGRLNSSIVHNTQTGSLFLNSCAVTATITFGTATAGTANLNVDPLFVGANDFHLLATSPARDAAQPALIPVLVFSPSLLFGVDILSHDAEGAPRPQGAGLDLGMFED